MRTAFLESRFQTPALHEIAHDLVGWLRWIGGKQRFGRPLSRWVAGEDPPNGQRHRAKALPPGGARTQLQYAFAFPVPVQGDPFPDGLGVWQYVLERGKTLAHDARTPNRVRTAHGSRLVHHGVETKRGNQ